MRRSSPLSHSTFNLHQPPFWWGVTRWLTFCCPIFFMLWRKLLIFVVDAQNEIWINCSPPKKPTTVAWYFRIGNIVNQNTTALNNMPTKGERRNLSLLKVQQQTAEATCFTRRLWWDFYKPAVATFTFTTLCKLLLVFERANLSCHPHAIVIHAFKSLCTKKKW